MGEESGGTEGRRGGGKGKYRTLEPYIFIHSIYPPTGGAGENTSSSGSGVSTAEMKAYNAKVALAGNKGMEGRKASKASIDPKEVERQVLRDELFAQEKRLAGLTTELKKTKGTLAERTTELRSQRRRSRIITGQEVNRTRGLRPLRRMRNRQGGRSQ